MTEYPVWLQLGEASARAYLPFAVAILLWLALTIPALVMLARRKLDTPSLGILFGGIALLFMPPFGLTYLLALSLFLDRDGRVRQ